MDYALDAALALFILLVIVVNTYKGFKTVLNLIVTVVSFGAAYMFGPTVGQLLATEAIYNKVADVVKKFIDNLIGESVEATTVGDLLANLPEQLRSLIEKAGIDLESVAGSYGDTAIIDENAVMEFVDKIAQPIANGLAIAFGCIIVFVAALILMLIIKGLLMLLFKDPAFKGVGRFFGFIVGLLSAFVWTWVICLVIGLFVQYSLLGEYNSALIELTESSYIFEFYSELTLAGIIEKFI